MFVFEMAVRGAALESHPDFKSNTPVNQ